jgi:NAD(P)-dependent dehydrogenase (short-subunit alcohol dehydrogenase family)
LKAVEQAREPGMSGAVVIGAGSGIGQSVARRFAREGMPIALVTRTRKAIEAVAEALVLDVDGVLNPWAAPACPADFREYSSQTDQPTP